MADSMAAEMHSHAPSMRHHSTHKHDVECGDVVLQYVSTLFISIYQAIVLRVILFIISSWEEMVNQS